MFKDSSVSDEENSINSSISALENYITKNQDSSKKLLTYLMIFSISILMIIMMLYIFPSIYEIQKPDSVSRIPESVLYGLLAIFIVVFGVLMAVYRFHLNEIARTEHYKMGFMRIRVAANNHHYPGFDSEVRVSLTNEAFTYNPSSVFSPKDKKVDSPLPGHPTSDLSAVIINKLLDGIDIKKK